MYTSLKMLGTCVIQTNLSKFDKRLFSKIYLCRSLLKQEKYRIFIFWGREFQREKERT